MSEQIEGRNAVLEAFRSGRCVDKLFILDGCQDGPVRTIAREARKKDTIINYVPKERLDQLSETGAHQGVIAQVAAYEYATVEDILEKYFYCYSRPLKQYLYENGIRFITKSIHDKTKKSYWLFEGTEKLNKLLDEWRLRKP